MRLEESFLNSLAQDNLTDVATQMAGGTEPAGTTPMTIGEFATSVADVPAGLLKGAVQGTIGLPGDIESLTYGVREIFNRGAGESALDAFLTGLEQKTVLPTTENVRAWLDTNVGPLVPAGASERRREAAKIPEFVGELGGAGKTVMEGTKAIGRGLGRVTGASADMVRPATPEMQAGVVRPSAFMPEAAKFQMPSFARAIPETFEEIDRIYDYLEDLAKKSGFRVSGGSSNVSGSRYLTIIEDLPNDDVRDIQIRISNHGDRHPFTEASEGKISIDPSRGGTDLEDTLYQLQEKGFNLIEPEAAQKAAIKPTKKISNKKIGELFNRLVNDARDDFEEVMSNWQGGVFLNEDKDKLITYPGRDQAFSRGKEGGKVTVTKKEMIEWLMSDGPFDEKVYGPEIKNDKQWVDQIERLRSIIKGEQ